MSRDSHRGLRHGGGPVRSTIALVIALMTVLVLVGARAPAAVAQDASPAASPAAVGPCEAPEVPPGTPEPMPEEMGPPPPPSPEASPEDLQTLATPEEVGEEGFEEPPPPPVGTPVADEAVAEEAIAGVQNFVNCFNSGNYLGLAALSTENDRLNEFGTTNVYTVAAQYEMFAGFIGTISLGDVNEVQMLDDGRLAVDANFLYGNSLDREVWVLAEEEGFLKLDDQFFLGAGETSLDSVVIRVTMAPEGDEYAYALSTNTVQNVGAIVIQGVNEGAEPHEIVLVTLPEGVDPAALPADAPPPPGTVSHGFLFAAPGQQSDLVLEGLEPGTYTLLCFIPNPEGVSHHQLGMVAELTVTPAEGSEDPAATPDA